MEEYLLGLIEDISLRRREKGVTPSAALMSEIQNEMMVDAKEILNRLCKEEKLTFHRTLNDVSFEKTGNNLNKIL